MNKLKKNEIILFPTETVLGIGCLLDENCVKRLRKITKRPKDKPFAILLSNKEEIKKWVKDTPPAYKKLSKLLPGPLTLIFKGKDFLPKGVISKNGTVGIRIPDYKPILNIIRDAGLPLIATSANISGKPTPLHTDDVELKFDNVIPGSSGFGIPSTVLDITKKNPILLRKGMISIIELENSLRREIALGDGVEINVLYICSGNMCRSPMAEAHLKSLIKDMDIVKVRSAGTIAVSGMPLSIGAGLILEEENIDIQHQSIHVEKPILNWADIIFVMEEEHKDYLVELSPENKSKILLLANFKDKNKTREIEDPIGKDIEVYREVFEKIKTANKKFEKYLRRKIKK
jgi:tRNA threonylcarbamoyl adenosine modification protein (Sua5/YciO/YrdC/YwlC family)